LVVLGVWVHPPALSSRRQVEEVVERAARVPIEKLVVLVKDGEGRVHFRCGGSRPEYDYLRDLVELAGDRGLEVHAWFVVLREGGESPKGWLAENPRCAVVDESGRPVGWICPSREESRRRVLGLFRELLEGYEVDGVHLDYIRYPEPAVARGCFCELCGRGGYADEGWVMRGAAHVTELVEEAHELVKEYGAELSAAVFPNYPECLVWVRQDWVRWVREGLLDWVAPMNYTNIVEVFRARALVHAALVPDWALLLEGVGKRSSVSSLSPGKLLRQAEAAVRAGADGVVVFSYTGMGDDDFRVLKALAGRL